MKAQDHFYAALVESSDDAIVAKDLGSVVVSWNPAAERLFGYSAEEMVGESIRRLIPPERQQEEDAILAKITQGERFPQFTTERLRKDGSRVKVFVTVSPVLDRHGNIVGACKMARDATAYLAAQRRIEESERLFRALADNIPQIAWVAEPDGRVSWANCRLEEYTGLTAAEIDDGRRAEIHHPEHMIRVLARYHHSMETGEEWEEIFPLKGRDGQYRWFLARAHPVHGSDGRITHWVGTHTDIHDQREQTDKVRLMLNEINHRTKNLIATVQALARRTATSSDQDFVERFEARMMGLATNQDLLVRGEWREVDLEELIRRQLGFLGDDHRQFEISGPSAALTAPAAEAIGMAAHELATNSLKYGALSVGRGKVAIGWEIDLETAGLHLWWRERGGPAVSPPARKGFGTTLIAELPRAKLQAEVTLEFDPAGLRWSLAGEELLARHAAGIPAE
ncbi:MAG: PAS domain S-box protein [Candidatus Andeanibacterium colombiense]|uniref:histidine kinase n=1 Tax=Candidatus Andeanibacterium colombiense TaxID=3121345 RepID=A0AAJ5X8C1_9SPHN|nr:MAG: PAS domain S-box protein [Sphingomonadaceae bacterium]